MPNNAIKGFYASLKVCLRRRVENHFFSSLSLCFCLNCCVVAAERLWKGGGMMGNFFKYFWSCQIFWILIIFLCCISELLGVCHKNCFLIISFFRENYFFLVVENKVPEAGRGSILSQVRRLHSSCMVFYINFNLKEYICSQFSVQKNTKLTSAFYISMPMYSASVKH